MSLRSFVVMGVFWMGTSLHAAPASQEELVIRMYESDHKQEIDLQLRPDLERLVQEAHQRAQNLQADCYSAGLYEVALSEGERLEAAGYQAGFVCEDAPAPGVALFFDTSHQYLGTLSIDP